MKLLLVDNIVLYKDKGKFYSPSIYNNEFFSRYSKIFSKVEILAKTKKIIKKNVYTNEIKLCTLSISTIPYFKGFIGLILSMPLLIFKLISSINECNALCLRIGQVESYIAYIINLAFKKPYFVEVVNDPETIFKSKSFINSINLSIFKQILLNSTAASFVTDHYLQNKYLPKNHKIKFLSSYSSINLTSDYFNGSARQSFNKNDIRIIHVSNTIQGNFKGHFTVVDIVEKLLINGINVTVSFLGDGSSVDDLKHYIKSKNISNKFSFLGLIKSEAKKISLLKSNNLFLYPSQMDGLPRSLIEAMAVGLPCLASNIAGIPELIEVKYLKDPNDVDGFYHLICYLIDNQSEIELMSKTNVKIASKFKSSHLNRLRKNFYESFKNFHN